MEDPCVDVVLSDVVISAVSIVPAVVSSSEPVWLVSDRFRILPWSAWSVWRWWGGETVLVFLEKKKKLRLGFFSGVGSFVVPLRDFLFLLGLVDQENEEGEGFVVVGLVVVLRLNKEDLDFGLSGLVMVGKSKSVVGRLELESILE